MPERRPSVSIVLPTLNERAFIVDCLDSLSAQTYDHIVEVLVVDGGSTDGTRELVETRGGRVRLVDNPRTTAAAAMNIGIETAVGDVIVRADAHSLYAEDYVTRCIDVLSETEADNVGGPMRPIGTTTFGRAVAAVTTSVFGVGPGRFHVPRGREDVDTVYLGCYPRRVLEKLGGYDETALQWAAEDHELNFRLTRSGGRIVLDPQITSWYFPRETPHGLARQYFNYGVGKVSTLNKHRMLPTWRPLVPAALVSSSLLALVSRRGATRVAIPVVHGAAVAAVAGGLSRQRGLSGPHVMLALLICHWSYGTGFLRGIVRVALRQPFVSRPRGHR